MKYLLNILVIFSFSLILVGCGDDDYEEQPLSIVKSVQEFEAVGGNQKVTVEGIENASIQSDKDWCTATLSGNTLSIDVPANNSYEGRTAQLTLKLTNQTVFVNVYQKANLFWIEGLDFLNKKISFPPEGGALENMVVNSNLPIEITKSADWIKYTYTDGILSISAGASSIVRQGTITFKSGDREETFTVTQISMPYENYIGEWNVSYLDGYNDNSPVSAKAVIAAKENGTSYTLTISTFGTLTAYYNSANQSITIAGGEELGVYAVAYDLVSGFVNPAGSVTVSGVVQMEAVPDYIDQKITCAFADNGTWPNNVVDGFFVAAFRISDGGYAGGFEMWYDLTLTR